MKDMKKKFLGLLAVALCLSCSKGEDVCDYVDPLVGTADNGHTFPGACVPFGFVQPGPDSGNDEWKYCSGFNIADDSLIGFSQNHLNGTGCQDLGDILLLPFSGEFKTDRIPYDKNSQDAHPGYYSVRLLNGVTARMTATERTAQYQFAYEDAGSCRLYVNFQNGIVFTPGNLLQHVLEADIDYEDGCTISGYLKVKNWVTRDCYFVMKFSEPYVVKENLSLQPQEKGDKILLSFAAKDATLGVKVALSTVSVEGAKASLEAENPGWDFERVRSAAHDKWHDLLSRVEVEGSVEQKKNVYTSLYHLYIQPNEISDIDGRFRGIDGEVHTAGSGHFFSTFSLWDTYRAAHPFYNILTPELTGGFVQSLVEQCDIQGYLPIWPLWGQETHAMIGNHAVPVLVEACLKGIEGVDAEKVYAAVRKSLTESHHKSDWETYEKYGYYPYDIVEVESVSRTMECCYDDYCASLLAGALGKQEDSVFFARRSRFFLNLFDPSSKLVRGKDSKGEWRTPFDKFRLSHAATAGGDYTEGNAWQYTWHVQQDPETLISLMGGDAAFESKLDSLFFLNVVSEANSGFVDDVTGLIGQYAHGNEPSHHVVYFYEFAHRPWKTEALVREVFDRFYRPLPDGLCGNDDCGQMSAWYLFSAMGFYPVDPVSGDYVLGAPQIPSVTLSLPGGKRFTSKALNLSEENKYVKSVSLNGLPVEGFKLSYEDIMSGGTLVFEMTDEPGQR